MVSFPPPPPPPSGFSNGPDGNASAPPRPFPRPQYILAQQPVGQPPPYPEPIPDTQYQAGVKQVYPSATSYKRGYSPLYLAPPPPNPTIPGQPDPEVGYGVIPRFDLQIQDLMHPGVVKFLRAIPDGDLNRVMTEAVRASFKWLYRKETVPTHVALITVILRAMPGVAHTTGHHVAKEIHFSLDYINKLSPASIQSEIQGVLVHEVVHCYQFNGKGTCPGGLIEGIADYVRLKARLSPPHWKRSSGTGKDHSKWDAGYSQTAYFLQYIEECFGSTVIHNLNFAMRDRTYSDNMFVDLTGISVSVLWKKYRKEVLGEDEDKDEGGGGGDRRSEM